MNKTVWIMNHYAGGMFFNRGGRHYSFSKYLKENGYNPVVFCCNAKHGSNQELYFDDDALWHEHKAEEIQTTFVYVRGRAYKGNGKQRILNMVDFYRNVKKTAKEYAGKNGAPDVILASSVHPLTLVAGIQLAKKFGIKCVCEIRDLWPESLVVYEMVRKTNPIVKVLYKLEKWIYKKADALIFTMAGGKKYISEKGWDIANGGKINLDKVYHINNGVDTETFNYNREHFQISDSDLENPNIFKVVYTGSIRKVNNLGILLDVAKKVSDDKVRFLIWGDGDEREMLEKRVQAEKISNVIFKGELEKKYIPYIISRSDVTFMHGNSNPLFRFGISPNKLFDYLAGKKPILMDIQCDYNIVEEYCAGIVTKDKNPTTISSAIENLCVLSDKDYKKFCENTVMAVDNYNYKKLTNDLVKILETV